MTTELLEDRLRNLAAAAPDAGRVFARVLATSPRRARPRWPRVSLGVVAAVVAIAVVAYFVPAAGTVVARIPLAGQLVGANSHVTAVGSSSTSSGITLTLTGAFADSTRTVLYIHSSPAIALLGPDASMTDQFGRTYHSSSGSSNTLSGDMVQEFEALAWPDQLTGARITLDIPDVQVGLQAMQTVRGSWRVSATLGVDEGTSLAPPAAVSLDGAHFTFTSVIYTPESIAIDVDMTGATSEDTMGRQPDPANPKGSVLLDFEVFDASGSQVLAEYSIDDGLFSSHVHILANRDDNGPATYMIRITFKGESADRSITVR